MARGELMKKLLAAYGHDEEFQAVARQIIQEEEQKNNRVLARTLLKTLEEGRKQPGRPRALAPVLPFPDAAGDFVELVEPTTARPLIVLTAENQQIFDSLAKEFRKSDEIHRHGIPSRSKLLFCGPPGCGKTLGAEAFAAWLGLPLYVVKVDRLISSYLGETAGNMRKIFEFSRKQRCVLFFDEFDALARARNDSGEHNELRRVVNSLLIFIDRMAPRGFLIAATNLEHSLDSAVWRRFDEVIWFDMPDLKRIDEFLRLKFRNVERTFEPTSRSSEMMGYSFAEIERICLQAMRSAIVDGRGPVSSADFDRAITEEVRRRSGRLRLPKQL